MVVAVASKSNFNISDLVTAGKLMFDATVNEDDYLF